MNIQTYRRKFILIAMSAMTACLVLLLTMINLFNCFSVVAEQKDILSILSENGGRFPAFGSPMARKWPGHGYEITEESEHRVRFFVVTVSPEGDVVHVNLQQIAAVDGEEAAALGKRQIPGSVSFVPGTAGLILAGEVIKDLCQEDRHD